MRVTIRLSAWVPFGPGAPPAAGFVWTARVGAVLQDYDGHVGAGGTDGRLAGLFPVAHAAWPDVARSAAGRPGAEGIWLPTALLPRDGAPRTAGDRITTRVATGGGSVALHLRLDEAGRVISFVFDRWGDPDDTGTWAWHPFGGEVTDHRSVDGIGGGVPAAGRIGWHFGTARWAAGEFLRYRLTSSEGEYPRRSYRCVKGRAWTLPPGTEE